MGSPEQQELVRQYGQLTSPHEKRMILQVARRDLEDPREVMHRFGWTDHDLEDRLAWPELFTMGEE